MPITAAFVGRGTVFDGIAYWVTLAGIYLMVGGLMFYSGKGKLFDNDGDAPQGSRISSRARSSTHTLVSIPHGSFSASWSSAFSCSCLRV